MNKIEKMTRRLFITISKMDGLYYLWGKSTGVKENMLMLMYALYVLNDDEVHTQKQICDLFLVPKTTVNTIVKECIRKGLVTLENGKNLKEKNICLTEKGKEYAKELTKELSEIEIISMEKTLEKYSEEFVEAYEYLLENMKNEFEERFKNK